MRHEQASRLLNAYLDDELSDRQRADVERHLAACALCARHVAALRQVRASLQEWPAHARAANAEQNFWLQLARRLPARAARQTAPQSWRELLFPLGLAFGSAFVQAGALLSVAFSVMLALGAFAWLEPWLGSMLGNAPALSTNSLLRLTWTGWLTTEALSWFGVAGSEVELWIATALGWVGPALIVTIVSAFIFLGISAWAGAYLARRPTEFERIAFPYEEK